MTIQRRRFLQLAGAAAMVPSAPWVARAAETYPARPVHMIVGQASGSSSDITARLIAQWMSEHLGQQFIVEDRPGAGGNIATEAVMRAPADGYTMLLVNAQNSINAALYGKTDFVSRNRAGRRHLPRAAGDGGQSERSGEDGAGIHRLRQGQSGQGQHGVGRPGRAAASRRRALQGAGRRRPGARAVSRLDPGDHRPARRPGAGDVRRDAVVAAAHPGRQAARARDHHGDALGRAARPAAVGRVRAGLRGECLDRLRRAGQHAACRRSTSSTSRSMPRSSIRPSRAA